MNKFQLHLSGKGRSERAIRYRLLDIEDIDAIEVTVAVSPELKKGLTAMGYVHMVAGLGVGMMIVGMTEPVTPEKLHEAQWMPCTPDMFEPQRDADGNAVRGTGLSKYLTVKDIRTLREIYTMEHDVGKAEVDALLKGKVPMVD